MQFETPSNFPTPDFVRFGLAAGLFFPDVISEATLLDPLEKRRHFDWSWQAVRYRYRSCFELNKDFRALLDDEDSDWWKRGGTDEELTYKLERCIYMFFMSAISVFDSFAFCLYFFGHAIHPAAFPKIENPRDLTRKITARAFNASFPQTTITECLSALQNDPRFSAIEMIRNLVGHRISGRRSVRASSTLNADGTYTHRLEEAWHLPGAGQQLTFDYDLLQHHLDNITALVSALSSAAREFAEERRDTARQIHGDILPLPPFDSVS